MNAYEIKNAEITPETVRYIAYNPLTRRYEEVDFLSEVIGNAVIKQYWIEDLGRWVTLPGCE